MLKLRRALFFLTAVAIPLAAGSKETALDRYVKEPDPSYHWEYFNRIPGTDCSGTVLDFTSQTWKPPVAPDRTVWKHWLIVVRPHDLRYTTALLYITGGSNGEPAPAVVDPMLSEMANITHSVVVELRMVPNQPLTFPDASKPKLIEDQFIAYTWDKYLKTGKDIWPARLPMTKAAVKAMDAAQAFMQSDGIKIDHFVVAGASKRGWTTWTTAAVDKRVVAIVPMVIDLLNVQPSFEHQYRAYGFYSPALQDYENLGIMKWMGAEKFDDLMKIVDPYEYRQRLTMPKFIVNAAGDQYFLPDSSQFYFDQLKGEKYLRYIPNTDHSLKNSDASESVIAFYEAFLKKQRPPKFSWDFKDDGSIVVTTESKPGEVKLWQATNPDKRDFRLSSIGLAYKSTPLAPQPDGTYVAQVEKPAKGWTAYFVELTFPTGGKYPEKFTTAVRVTPDTLPFPAPKSGSN